MGPFISSFLSVFLIIFDLLVLHFFSYPLFLFSLSFCCSSLVLLMMVLVVMVLAVMVTGTALFPHLFAFCFDVLSCYVLFGASTR